MGTGRIILTWWLTCTMAAAAWAAKPPDYREELRQARSYQERKRYRECIALCEKMLAQHKEAWQAKEVAWLKIECLVSDSQYDSALKELADLPKAFADDKALQAAAALRAGDVLQMRRRFDEAVAAYRQLAQLCASDAPDQAAEALLRAGRVLCADLDRPAEGIALYQQVEARFAAWHPRQAAEAVRSIAATHEGQTKDLPAAAAAYRRLTDKYAAVYDQPALTGLYARGVDCLIAAKQPAEALAAARKAEADLQADAERASFAVRQAGILLDMDRPAEARAECERAICSYPLQQKACQQAQGKIVETHRAEGKWAEALGAARTLYDAAGDEQGIRSAAQTVAQAFLAADGNLRRANEFLSYQRYGPEGPDGKNGTQDDIAANHLAGVKYPPFSAACDKRFQEAIKAQPDTYDGYRAKGMLYIYWGKPKQGAGQLLRAFKAADLAQVPAASQELVLIGMKACTASFRGLERIFEYISYGPKGKSGKEEIPDPFAGLP